MYVQPSTSLPNYNCSQNAHQLAHTPPVRVDCLVSDDGCKIKGLGEDIRLRPWVANVALSVKLLSYSHGFLGIDPQFPGSLLLQLLRQGDERREGGDGITT